MQEALKSWRQEKWKPQQIPISSKAHYSIVFLNDLAQSSELHNISSEYTVHVRDKDTKNKTYINEELNAIFVEIETLEVLIKFTQALRCVLFLFFRRPDSSQVTVLFPLYSVSSAK